MFRDHSPLKGEHTDVKFPSQVETEQSLIIVVIVVVVQHPSVSNPRCCPLWPGFPSTLGAGDAKPTVVCPNFNPP